jgi:hypothetical protein
LEGVSRGGMGTKLIVSLSLVGSFLLSLAVLQVIPQNYEVFIQDGISADDIDNFDKTTKKPLKFEKQVNCNERSRGFMKNNILCNI